MHQASGEGTRRRACRRPLRFFSACRKKICLSQTRGGWPIWIARDAQTEVAVKPLKRNLPGAALLALALALTACQGKPTAPGPTVLKIASQKGGTRSLMLAAHALDGAPYSVEWSEFPSAQTLIEALSAGAADAGAVGDAPFMFAYASGSKIKAVLATRAASGGASTAVLVENNSPIRSPADLKGKRIATGRGSIGHYLLLRVLEKAGLSPRDVNVIYLNPGDAKAAFTAGSVDAWATWNPYVGLAVLHGHARVLADGRGLLTGVAFEAATDAAIAGKRAALDDFLTRLVKAQRWEADHKPEFAAVLAKETGLPVDVATYTVMMARGAPVAIDASVLDEEHATLDHFLKAGVITVEPTIDGAFDTSFSGAIRP
jgi:sulfonate transport system substrate-binding protein